MGVLQDAINKVEQLKKVVKDHPMCLHFEENYSHYFVTYPLGDFGADGVIISREMGSAKALERLLEIMERHWVRSYPGS